MAKKRQGAEQIIPKLREAEVKLARGLKVPQVCKKLEVTEQTYYRWRKKYGGLRMDQAKWPTLPQRLGFLSGGFYMPG